MKSIIPKVMFILAPLDETCNLISRFLAKEHIFDWSEMIYKEYPKLKRKLKGVKDKNSRKDVICKFFKEVSIEKKIILEKQIKSFQVEWDRINEDVMKALSDIVELEWTEMDRKIVARVTLNYFCICLIKKRIFDVYYKQDFREMKETCIHEILHFIYSEKFMKVFPETKINDLANPPKLAWHLLEIVPGILLNDDRIQRIFKNKFESYEEYRKLKINKRPLLSYIQAFYDERDSFEEFLKKSYEFIENHETEIRSIK
jgi:hypothetical protein